jgi:hypothetical protein
MDDRECLHIAVLKREALLVDDVVEEGAEFWKYESAGE